MGFITNFIERNMRPSQYWIDKQSEILEETEFRRLRLYPPP